jgi:hypothetical protein
MSAIHANVTTHGAGDPRMRAAQAEARASDPRAAARTGDDAATSRLEGLSRILRGVGAAALVAAASSFLLQHWDSGGDVWRYYALLAHTGLLGALGFAWGLRADDAKGARTFLALAAGLVPAHFCILGGLVYSRFSWDGALTPVARYATWVAPDGGSALLAVAATLAVLGGVTALAFVALGRARALAMGALYLVANALLLVPTRDPSVVAALAGTAVAALAVFELRVARRETTLRTLEGGFVRSMLWAPPALLLIRNALHYDLSSLYGAVACGTLALGTTAAASVDRLWPAPRAALRGAALACIGLASVFATDALDTGLHLPNSALLPLGGMLFASVATGISLGSRGEPWAIGYRRIAAWVLLGAMALDLYGFPGVVAAVACLVTSTVALSYGFLTRRRAIFLAGVAGAALSLLCHLRAAIDIYALSNWGSLAFVGIAVILVATLVEKRGAALAAGFAAWRERMAAWE